MEDCIDIYTHIDVRVCASTVEALLPESLPISLIEERFWAYFCRTTYSEELVYTQGQLEDIQRELAFAFVAESQDETLSAVRAAYSLGLPICKNTINPIR